MSQIISQLAEISDRYDALFVDLWGCVHNGITAFPEAVAALQTYRAKGGIVVLVTNAPRPRAGVVPQLAGFGVPEDAWDTIATSGDSARTAMFKGAVGEKVYFIGEDRDHTFFDPSASSKTLLKSRVSRWTRPRASSAPAPLTQARIQTRCGPISSMPSKRG